MLDPSLKNLLIETIALNMKTKDIDEIGKMISRDFNVYQQADQSHHVTLPVRTSATVLVDFMESKKKTEDLIKLIAELDNSLVRGRTVQIEGLEFFLQQLTLSGFVYDYSKRKVVPLKNEVQELPNWGALKNGKTYPVTVLSVDIVSNSELVNRYGAKTMKKVYTSLWKFLRHHLSHYNGRIWSWAGDGGIMAFAFKNHVERAVMFAIEVQRTIMLFNLDRENPLDAPIELRLGIHTGKLNFQNDTGKIISEVINLAAHLEKRQTEPGGVSITDEVYRELNPKLQTIFRGIGPFEGVETYKLETRLDRISIPEREPLLV